MSLECRGTTPVCIAGCRAGSGRAGSRRSTAYGARLPPAVVTDQSPESGAKVPAGTMVTLWIERGGGSGVREPRRPIPRPSKGRAMNDDPLDDAVGS
jgi:PASTA domain